MAQKVDHSALWMYVPRAGGVGAPTYFVPGAADGGRVRRSDGGWNEGQGLSEMLIYPVTVREMLCIPDEAFYPPTSVDLTVHDELGLYFTEDHYYAAALRIRVPNGESPQTINVNVPPGPISCGFSPPENPYSFLKFENGSVTTPGLTASVVSPGDGGFTDIDINITIKLQISQLPGDDELTLQFVNFIYLDQSVIEVDGESEPGLMMATCFYYIFGEHQFWPVPWPL